MRAAVMRGPGSIGCDEKQRPEPGAGEVRVRITACGVCGTDLRLFQLGAYGSGVTPGHEMAGVVDALGEGVEGLAPGDPVVVEPLHSCGACSLCRAGRHPVCEEGKVYGVQLDGGFADYVVVPALRLFRAPADLDPVLAALSEPAAVAIHGLRRAAFAPGQRVLVLGAGPVGLMAVAAARFLGAGPVEVSARYPQQAARAAELGADRVLREEEASFEALTALPAGRRPDLVIETVGGSADTLTAAAGAVAPGGAIAVLGLFLGPVTQPGLPLFTKEVTVAWSNCYVHGADRADFDDAVALVDAERERLAAFSTHRVPLGEIDRAYALAGDKRAGALKVSVVP